VEFNFADFGPIREIKFREIFSENRGSKWVKAKFLSENYCSSAKLSYHSIVTYFQDFFLEEEI